MSDRMRFWIRSSLTIAGLLAACAFCCRPGQGDEPAAGNQLDRGLVGHWPLSRDGNDVSGNAHHATSRGELKFSTDATRSAAQFNGVDAHLEVPASKSWELGTGEFSLAAWVHTDKELDDVPGDIVSQYDFQRRRGFHLTVKNNAGVANTQSNYRQLQFGIDDHRDSTWIDCGRPGEAILAFALAVFDGQLYAGTCEPGEKQAGHVYRYAGEQQWIDCGAPSPANAVTAMAVSGGHLYVGVGKYRLAGSALEESKNTQPGGRVFRYEGERRWTDCGQLPEVEAIGGMVVFRGRLYASSLYRPAGFFVYERGTRWTSLPVPDGKRVEALGVYNGFIYATSYDGGSVYRYDGTSWTDCGALGEPQQNTQTYSFAVHQGRLFVGTWPSGRVYRFEDVNRWTDTGRLGDELEVMGMLVHNGRLIAGTLPLAEVYQYQPVQNQPSQKPPDPAWQRMIRLDATPDVRYRRAWTMAEFAGRVFVSTLPSGRVYSFSAGTNVSWDYEFPAAWHHVAAVKSADRLTLYVDGKQVAQSSAFAAADYDLSSQAPLRIGFGASDYFCGRLSDVRLYRRALEAAEIQQLSQAK